MRARIADGNTVRVVTDPNEIRAAIQDKQPTWIDLEKQDGDSDALLTEVLRLHPLTIEDIWAKRSAPKLEDYENYLYVIVHGVRGAKNGVPKLAEIDVVIGQSWVCTHDPSGQVHDLGAEGERLARLLRKGPAWLAHAILDHTIDRYLPVIDEL